MNAAQQPLPLILPEQENSIVIGNANRLAYRSLIEEAALPAPITLLHGEEGSGKSMLAGLWQRKTGAIIVPHSLPESFLQHIEKGYYLLDNAEIEQLNPSSLFHLLNLIKETGSQLLITSRKPASALQLPLADVMSRLRAAHHILISQSDDEMLKALFIKLLSDRQLRVDVGVIDYCLMRMPRSFATLHQIVEALDIASLQQQRPITKVLIRELRILE